MEAHLIQRSDSWKKWREDKIGSSDAPVIMGISVYKSPLELYEEKKGLRPDQVTTYPMQRGTDMEPKAAQWYTETTGNYMLPSVEVHPEYDFLHASLDGLHFGRRFALEIKCPMNSSAKISLIEKEGIPEDYFCQIQHQINVANLDKVDLLIFDGRDGVIYPIVRDQNYIDRLLVKELEFYECLKTDTPPSKTQTNRKGKHDHIEAQSPEWENLATEIKASNERLLVEKEINEGLKARAKEICGGVNTKGSGMSVTFIRQKGNVDYSKIVQLEGVDLDLYRKEDFFKTMFDFG